MLRARLVSFLFTSLFLFSSVSYSFAQTSSDWYMAGANPQRTSWVASTAQNQTEILGHLKPEWYIPIEPYIHSKVQIIVSQDTIFLSTARGLYAFDSTTGAQKWVYPTELPLGNSPTVSNNIVYVGGYDNNIHAVNATTGSKLWTYEAGSGFDTNPLVVNDTVYMGSRDGYFYALNATTGTLMWKHETAGPIHYSAAAKPDNSVIYFASNDSYGYALNAATGALIWKQKLVGDGFFSWWPVYYSHPTQGDYVIFSANWRHRSAKPGDVRARWGNDMLFREYEDLYPDRFTQSTGQWVAPQTESPIPGDWATGTITIDASKPNAMGNTFTTAVTEYYEEPTAEEIINDPAGLNRTNHKPWKRLYLVINPSTGKEITYDFDQDGRNEYAPITTAGITHYGNRFPPVVGNDKVLYQMMNYISTSHIPSGGMVGWKVNSPYLSITAHTMGGVDQPTSFASGGKYIYYADLVDRGAGYFDISDPTRKNKAKYYDYINLPLSTILPDYNRGYIPTPDDDEQSQCCGPVYLDAFGGFKGAYGKHTMAQNPPIPYKGRVYMHKGNSLIAFKSNAGAPVQLPTAANGIPQRTVLTVSKASLKSKLEDEVRKMIAAGHLKPGYVHQAPFNQIEILNDYFHTPFETIYTLLRIRPHITDPTLLSQLDSYIQSEWTNYNPATINHIGWKDGAWREDFDPSPEMIAEINDMPKTGDKYSRYSTLWTFNPMGWYAMWVYAKQYGEAPAIFQSGVNSTPLMSNMKYIMDGTITDTHLAEFTWVHNGYIAGFLGFSNLYDLAVQQGMAPITGNVSGSLPYTVNQIKAKKDSLLSLRAQNFTKNTAYPKGSGDNTIRSLNPSRQFIYMVPELAHYLRTTSIYCVDGKVTLDCVRDAVDQFNTITPYWMVPRFDVSYREQYTQSLYDYNSIFQAKALILNEPLTELVKYLEAPYFARGDLFYIQNVVSTLEATGDSTTIPGDVNGDGIVNLTDLATLLSNFGRPGTRIQGDLNGDGNVNLTDLSILLSNFGK